MTFQTPSNARSPRQRAGGGRARIPAASGLEEATEQVAGRAPTQPAAVSPQVVLGLQRLAGNRAAAMSVQRMCGLDSANLVVEESAMKHKIGLQGQAPRLPSEDDVRKQFHVNMKFGKPEPDDRDPTATKVLGGGSKMVFKKTGNTYTIFHFHALHYEGDRDSSSSSGSRSSSSGGRWNRGGGSSRRW